MLRQGEDPAGAGGAGGGGPGAPGGAGGGGGAPAAPVLLVLLFLLPPCPLIMRASTQWSKQMPCTTGAWPSNSFGLCSLRQMKAGVITASRKDTGASFAAGVSLCPLGISFTSTGGEFKGAWRSARDWLTKACNLARTYDPNNGVYAIFGPGPQLQRRHWDVLYSLHTHLTKWMDLPDTQRMWPTW